MAKYPAERNPFFTGDEDIDDDTFLRHSQSGNSGYLLNSNTNAYNGLDDLERKRQDLLQRKRQIEEETIQSTQRSLSNLRHSEQVGIATAEELVRQREQLQRTEKRLDDINTTLKFSQKHIQSIKSVFGGLKNLLSGRGGNPTTPGSSSQTFDEFEKSPLSDIIDKNKDTMSQADKMDHPAFRVRGLSQESPTTLSDPQAIIDNNLDEMLNSVTKLKGLARGLGDEIETHNDIIENVIVKVDKADTSLSKNNKSLRRLLK